MTGPALEGELVDAAPARGVVAPRAGRPDPVARYDVKGPRGLLPAYADLSDPDERVPLDVDEALRDAIPDTTWRTIDWGWGRFIRWCGTTNRKHDPPTIGTVRTYIWAHLTWTRKDGVTLAGRGGRPYAYATVETALGVVCKVLQWQGYPSPWKHPGVQAQLKAYDKKLRQMGIMPAEAYALTPDEQARVVRTRDMGQVAGVRDAAALALHMATGCRAAELMGLDDGDLEWESRTRLLVTIRVGKGGAARRIPVEADEPDEETGESWAPDVDPLVLVSEWQDLKRARGIKPGGPLFLECKVGGKRNPGKGHSGVIVPGKRMTTAAYDKMHHRATSQAGVDVDEKGNPRHVTTHSERAAFVTNASDAGVPVERIRMVTGHSPNSPVIFRYVRSGLRWGDHNPLVQVRRAAIVRRRRATRGGSGS
ncbi:tyrosine-type recombinase/integrase [Micromonospora sp. NPDC049230]|uniref:tyrosine-type recombinase/integrase n=1 Tax=Micromonospora sp. NPDC049230 TaxID=3155502 RepID=UPI0033C46CBE